MSEITGFNINGRKYGINSNIIDSSIGLAVSDTNIGDFSIRDEAGNVLVKFKDGHIQTKNFDSSDITDSSSNTVTKKTIRVLSLGNSYSEDAFGYVPSILEDILGDDINIQFGILSIASSTLEMHYSQFINNSSEYSFKLWLSSIGYWTTTSNYSLMMALQNYTWDIIIFQQQSSRARDYSTYQPYLNDLIKCIFDVIDYPIKLAWHLTPPYPTGAGGLGSDTTESMYTKIIEAVTQLMDETAIEVVFPDGTAIMNAMTTSLDSLGNFGHLFYEGLHLQEGIPCLLEAYVATLTLLDLYGFKNKSIFASTIMPDDIWIQSKAIPETQGNSVGVTEDNIFLAMEIALMTYKKPYEKTDCGVIFE